MFFYLHLFRIYLLKKYLVSSCWKYLNIIFIWILFFSYSLGENKVVQSNKINKINKSNTKVSTQYWTIC